MVRAELPSKLEVRTETAPQRKRRFGAFGKGCWDFNFLPTDGVSIKPLKVKLFAGEQQATKVRRARMRLPR